MNAGLVKRKRKTITIPRFDPILCLFVAFFLALLVDEPVSSHGSDRFVLSPAFSVVLFLSCTSEVKSVASSFSFGRCQCFFSPLCRFMLVLFQLFVFLFFFPWSFLEFRDRNMTEGIFQASALLVSRSSHFRPQRHLCTRSITFACCVLVLMAD